IRFPGQTDLDLKAQGIGKLLGSGDISHKVTVKVDHASAGAIEKVKAAGGQVTVLVAKVVKAPAKPDAKAAPKPGTPPGKGAAPAAPAKDAKPAAPKGDKPAGKPADKK
ncbi:MAG: uL15 family ribosomal protein, partial [Thermoplasmatota archaeon]